VIGQSLGVLWLLRKVSLVLVCQFHFLNCTWEAESYHSNSLPHIYSGGPVSLGKCGRRVLHIQLKEREGQVEIVEVEVVYMRKKLEHKNSC